MLLRIDVQVGKYGCAHVRTTYNPCCRRTGGFCAFTPERLAGILCMLRMYPSDVVTWRVTNTFNSLLNSILYDYYFLIDINFTISMKSQVWLLMNVKAVAFYLDRHIYLVLLASVSPWLNDFGTNATTTTNVVSPRKLIGRQPHGLIYLVLATERPWRYEGREKSHN